MAVLAMFQLWESVVARAGNAEDPGHAEALEASGMRALARTTRSGVFDDAELQRVAPRAYGE